MGRIFRFLALIAAAVGTVMAILKLRGRKDEEPGE